MDGSVLPVLKALADEQRVRILALLIERERSAAELSEVLAMRPGQVEAHLDLLRAAGLVTAQGERYRYSRQPILDALKSVRGSHPREDAESEDERILATFLRDGRLVQIPSQEKKRLVILRYLAGHFEPGRLYPEPEVNEILRAVHPDVASLRRYLVESGLMQRQIEGRVDLAALQSGSATTRYTNLYWRPENSGA